MSDYPDIRKGTLWPETSARKWQTLIGDVDRLARPDPGLVPLFENRTRRHRKVAIVAEVASDATSLVVRGIRYASPLPVEGEYEWSTAPFDAYPDVGQPIADYESLYWPDELPNLETPVLGAYYINGAWLVSLPGAGIEFAWWFVLGQYLDTLACLPVDDLSGEETTEILKPNELQTSLWDGRTVPMRSLGKVVHYTWLDPLRYPQGDRRFAYVEGREDPYTEFIIPEYRKGRTAEPAEWKLILAAKLGSTSTEHPDALWQDLNIAGRAWAVVPPTGQLP